MRLKNWHIIWSKSWRQESHNLHVHFLCGIWFLSNGFKLWCLPCQVSLFVSSTMSSFPYCIVLCWFFSCFFFDKWPPICILHNLFTKWDIEKDWLANVTKTLKCCACRRLVDKVAIRGYIIIIFNFSPWRPTRFNGGPKLIGWTHNMGGKALVYKHKLFRILISSHTLRLLIFKWINVKASHVWSPLKFRMWFFFS